MGKDDYTWFVFFYFLCVILVTVAVMFIWYVCGQEKQSWNCLLDNNSLSSCYSCKLLEFSNSSSTKMACQNLFSFIPFLYMYRKYGVAGNNFSVTIQIQKQTNKALIVSILVLNGSLNNNHQYTSNYDGSTVLCSLCFFTSKCPLFWSKSICITWFVKPQGTKEVIQKISCNHLTNSI